MSAGAIASVSGILIEKQVPWPSVEESEMEPPIASIFAHHIHADRGRKRSSPPSKSQAQRLKRQISIAHARDFDLLGEAERNRFLSNARNIQTAAIVDDIDRDLAASCEALIRIVPASGLPFASLSTEVLDPMRRAIADHVRQRIADESISWRSSAVSAPSVTRWIFLPTSAATSCTSRGRPPNRRPTGCMRARMTASCRSEISPERRCRGRLDRIVVFSPRKFQKLIAGQTSSETSGMMLSSTPTVTRIVSGRRT